MIFQDTPNKEKDTETYQVSANSCAPEIESNQPKRIPKQMSSLDEARVESLSTGDSSKPGTKGEGTLLSVPGIGAVVEPAHVATVLSYLAEVAAEQNGMINPTNFCHYMCPPLEGHVVSSSPES